MQRIYLDYASTTPVDPEVMKAMKPYFADQFGNPGSLHYAGQEAIGALDKSREMIARFIGADFREIIFTSSATEANNLALRGVLNVRDVGIVGRNQQPNKRGNQTVSTFRPRIIISAIEHESILETCRALEADGLAEVIYLPVDKKGFLNIKRLEESLNKNTVLVSIMYANNETGVIQPIKEIVEIVRNVGNVGLNKQAQRSNNPAFRTLVHTDASQAFQYLDCNVNDLGVDLMTLSSHKIYGPKGAGALYVRNDGDVGIVGKSKQAQQSNGRQSAAIQPLISGGNQEFGLRSGTENIPAIVGFAKAVEIADALRDKETKRIGELRDYLWKGIKKIYPKAQLNGDQTKRLPNNINVYLPGVNAEELLIKLDMKRLAVSTGSACKARALDSSHVLEAMGFKEPRAKNSLRFSLGRPTTYAELDKVLRILLEL